LDDDVQHIDAFPRLGDVRVAFEILIHCFIKRFYYYFRSFPPLLDFQCYLTLFDSTFIHVFGKLLTPIFFECSKVFLVH